MVRIVEPELRTIDYSVDQPGFVDAYEQTSIFSKVSGIHQALRRGHRPGGEKRRSAGRDLRARIGRRPSAKTAQVGWTKEGSSRPGSWWSWPRATSRWPPRSWPRRKRTSASTRPTSSAGNRKSQRLTANGAGEGRRQANPRRDASGSSIRAKAARDAAEAAVAAREADRPPAEANLGKAKIDVETAKAKVKVVRGRRAQGGCHAGLHQGHRPLRRRGDGPQRQHRRLRAGGDRRQIDGQSVGHFRRGPHRHGADFRGRSRRLRPLRRAGDEGRGPRRGLSGLQIPAAVTRTSWAIREKTRTLRAEIDLSREEYDGLRPGMYVYTKVLVQRPQRLRPAASRRSWCRATRPTAICCKAARRSRRPSRPA